MSTAAHEPHRVGPRRADSPSGSKVTPRRNAPEVSETNGMQYDSDELPVLIRLPDLHDPGSVESRTASPAGKKRRRIDRASLGKQKSSKQNGANMSKKTFQQRAVGNKLVLGGIVGGMLVVVTLFLFNAGSPTPPADQDGWASEAAELVPLVHEPEFSLPAENESPPLFPGFAYEAPNTETAQYARGQLDQSPIGVPYYDEPQTSRQSETAGLPNNHRAVVNWPWEEATGSQSNSGPTPKDLWPGEGLSLERGGYEYAPADSPSQTDDRSSMYPSETESFRMGKLDSDRPQATLGDRSSILNGNIEIPDTTSLR